MDLRIDHLSARSDHKIPQTFHARMLYICGLWEKYKNMSVDEREAYRGFSFQKKRNGWRPGSCTLNVPISAIKAFRNEDFNNVEAFQA